MKTTYRLFDRNGKGVAEGVVNLELEITSRGDIAIVGRIAYEVDRAVVLDRTEIDIGNWTSHQPCREIPMSVANGDTVNLKYVAIVGPPGGSKRRHGT